MVNGQLCDRCRTRPAVASVRQMRRGRPPQLTNLCEACLAEGRVATGPGRRSLFEEFLAELFEQQAPEGATPLERQQPPQQIDITRSFSDATRHLLQRAARRAADVGSLDLDTDHLLWGALGDEAVGRILSSIEIDPELLRQQLDEETEKAERTDVSPELAPDAKNTLLVAYQESRTLGHDFLGPEHVLLALVRDGETTAGQLLERFGATHTKLRGAVIRGVRPDAEHERSRTSTLDQHSRDLTGLADEGRLDPVIGRNDEIEQAIEILSRRTKNNPVLIGDPGVGKTAIAEGIAQRIVSGDVPEVLEGKRLVNLDLGGLLAGTRHRGDFEERLKNILDEVTASQDTLLLFIDELHTIVGAGAAEGAMDAANMLKPALARGELHVIGATTLDEYRKNIERDAALERRFQPIMVGEPSVEETVQILYGLKDRYEAFHRVRIGDDAIEAAAELSDRYVTDRFLPDKAIDLIDQASARVKLRVSSRSKELRDLETRLRELDREKAQAVAAEEFERAGKLKEECEEIRGQLEDQRGARQRAPEVTEEDIAEIVSRSTGIPVAQLTQEERERLLRLEDRLHERVVGQDEAVNAVSEAIRRSRAGLGDPDRPIGSFLFLGPTGVGKTELARTLAEAMFGDQDRMVRFDMSEYQERHTVSRMVGAPPGYVGYEEAGQLTERVRRRPYSVILLDEIEKAHPDVFNVLLQILDDGRLTDAQGRTVDFTNTVIVMTSNLGAERIQGSRRPVGFATDGSARADGEYQRLKSDLLDVLRGNFRPEFLNRIDDVVVFRPLEREQLVDITRLLVERMRRRLAAKHIDVEITDDALEHLADVGFDPEFGARPLRRAIQRQIENELSRLLLADELVEGDRVKVDEEAEELVFDVFPDGNADGPELEDWEAPKERQEPVTSGPSAPRR